MEARDIKKVLITGISGAAGSYLAEYLSGSFEQVEIHGTVRLHSTSTLKNLSNCIDKITLHESDLNDLSSITQVINTVKPEAIIHLASNANIQATFKMPVSILHNNIIGTTHLFEAVRISKIDPIIQMCSSSKVYGNVNPKHVPIKENCPVDAVCPYGVSKVAQDFLASAYHGRYGMKVIRTRMFPYINPRREDLFAGAFAKQIAEIEMGRRNVLDHGNLDSLRTFIDIRDAVIACWLSTVKARVGHVYNIGGSTKIRVGEILEMLKKNAKCDIPTQINKALLRPTDVTLQIPDVSKFKNDVDWKPKYTIEQSIEYLLAYWRNRMQMETQEGYDSKS